MSRSILSTLWRVALVGALALGLSIEMQAASGLPAGRHGPRDPDLRMEIGAPELPAPAVSTEIRLSSYAKVITANSKKVLSEVYTVAEAKATFPDCFRAMQTMRNWTEAQVMSLALFNAVYTDAVWRGAQYQRVTDANGNFKGHRIISRNHVVCDLYGGWWFNDNVCYAFGTYTFLNGGPGNAEYAGDLGGFELMHWHERWVGPASNRSNGDRVLFGAQHGGSDNLIDYSEGTWFNGALRIDGRAGNYARATGPPIVGFELFDLGEVSNANGGFVHHCDIGIRFARGTPANAPFTMSSFSNNIAGFECNGVANLSAAMFSSDDCPVVLRSVPGYGRPATINGIIQSQKVEFAVTPMELRLWKPAHVGEFEDQFNITYGLITYAATNARTRTMFVLKPDVYKYGDSYLGVKSLDVFDKKGPDYFVIDVTNGKAWPYDPNVKGFDYFSYGGGTLVSWPKQVEPVPITYTQRSGYVGIGEKFAADGSPFWSNVTGNGAPTGPGVPPPTTPSICSYTYTAWSTCTNGTQTRTVTSTAPPGCVGTPVLSQACSTPTPAPVLTFATTFSGSGPNLVATKGTAIAPSNGSTATFTSGVITTNANTKYPWAPGRAQRIVLLGVTLKAAPAYQYLTANHVVYPGGKIYYRADPLSAGGDIDTGLSLTLNVKVTSLTLPCPGGILNTVIGSPVGAGNGAPLTIEALEVWQ